MELKKTIDFLNEGSRKSKKEGHKFDAANYSFKVWVLKLLKKIAKICDEKDEVESVLRESGKQRFRCRTCNTKGYVESWSEDYDNYDKNDNQKKIIEDCEDCNAQGFNEIEVVDKRKKSKDYVLEYNDEY